MTTLNFVVQVVTGCISSIEDHGYIIDLGVKSMTSFLGQGDAIQYVGEGMDLLFYILDLNLHKLFTTINYCLFEYL